METRREFVAKTMAGAAGVALGRSAVAGQPQRSKQARPQVRTLSGPLRVAQIGRQGHTGEVLDGIPQLEDCRLVAVARGYPGENIEKLRRYKAWNDEVKVFDDYRRMLDEAKPDVVGVCLPYTRNSEASIEAVRRGCHVVSEKPLATSLADLAALRAARDEAGVRVTAMLPMRLWPDFMAAHQAVKNGLIGEPVLASAQKSYRWGTDRPDHYKRRATYGGSIPWIGIHAVDLIRFVSGLEYAAVAAVHATKVHLDYPGCEDCGAILFWMVGGGQASMTIDYLRPKAAPSHGDDRLRVVGSKGIVEVRHTDKTFCQIITEDEAPAELSEPERHEHFFVNFVNELRGGPPHILAPDEPFRATEVCLKARDAADSGKIVKL